MAYADMNIQKRILPWALLVTSSVLESSELGLREDPISLTQEARANGMLQ